MNSEVRNQRRSNLTYTLSDNLGKHQGGDFILEGNVAFLGGSQISQNPTRGIKLA